MSDPRRTNIEADTPSSSSEDEELPPLPASRPASVISVATSLKPKSTSELRGQSSKVEKHHKKESSTSNKLKQLFTKEPSLIANIESLSKSKKPATMSDDNGIKPKNPDTYSGGTKDLERYLSQCQLYFLLKKEGFKTNSDKVLFAGSHLRGPAADWFAPFIRDLSKGQRARQETQTIFSNYANFEAALEQLYGSRNKQRTAVRQMQQLKQTGPASQYTATFRRLAMDSEWDNTALTTMYYSGLKDTIKDELSRGEQPDTLSELIDKVITIDERLFERQMERTRPGTSYGSRQNKPYYGPQPMDLSATRGPLTKRDREHRMKNNLCLYCGKPGHRARECNANGKRQMPAIAATRNHNSYDSHEDYDYNNGPPQYLKATRSKPIPSWVKQMSEMSSTNDRCNEWLSSMNSENSEPDSVPKWKGAISRDKKHKDHRKLLWSACFHKDCMPHREEERIFKKSNPKTRMYEEEDLPQPLNIPGRTRTPYPRQKLEQHNVNTGRTQIWYPSDKEQSSDEPDSADESESEPEEEPENIYVGKGAKQIMIPQGRLIYWSYTGTHVLLRITVEKTGDLGNLTDFPYKPFPKDQTRSEAGNDSDPEAMPHEQKSRYSCYRKICNSHTKPSMRISEHDSLSWTACYDDSCTTHKSDKDGSGFYPQQPKPRGINQFDDDIVENGIDNVQEDQAAKDEAARHRSNEERQVTRLQEIPDSQDDSPPPSEEPTSTPPSSSDEEELPQW